MKRVVESVDAYHDCYVREAVEEVQGKGYEVTDIKKVKSMKLGIIGRDVTHITYSKCQN